MLVLVAACARHDAIVAPHAKTDGAAFAPLATGSRLTQSVPGAVPSPAGLKACFSADNSTTDVVGGMVGTLNGAAGYVPGRFGQAFNFTAINDGVAIPNSASSPIYGIGGGSGITFAAWIYPRGTSFGGAPGAGPIVEFDFGAQLWQHNQTGDEHGLFTNMALSNATSDYHILQIPGVVPWNAWQHVAATYDKASGNIQLWVNGVSVGISNQGSFSPNTQSSTFRIGQRVLGSFTGGNFAFNGLIDEVQVYDHALSPAEIAQLAAATGTMCVPPPAAYQVTQMPVSSGESGVPFTTQPQVAILDANGNIVSNATTAVTATITSGAGTLIGTTTVNAVNGVATFTNLAIAGASSGTTIGFTAAGGLTPTGTTVSSPLTTVQVARTLGVVTQPGGAPSGALLAPQPVVEVRDAAGLRMPGATNAITVTLASGPGVLSGTTTVAASAATSAAAFTDLKIVGAGVTTLAFSATGLTGVTSNPFTVAATAATQLAILTPAAGGESGVPFTTQPVIEVRDANGNRATAATGTVTVSMTGTGGTLAGTVSAPIVNGLATFTGLQVNGVGTFTLAYAATGLTGATQAPVTVVQKVHQLAVISGPSTITNGVLITPPWVLELQDAAGIRVATSTYLVRASLTYSVTGTLTGTTEKNAVAGVVTFSDFVANVTSTSPITFTFWITDPSAYALAFTVSGNVTVLANVTQPSLVGLVRRGLGISSAAVTGSLQLLTADEVNLNGNAAIAGTLFVPGTPSSRTTGQSKITTTTDGAGSASPSDYTIKLDGNSTLTTLVRRTDPAPMPVVAAPPSPAGTRTVRLDRATDQVGTWATVRDLSISGQAGSVTMPAGTYGDISLSGGATLVLGVAGSTTPAVYNVQSLSLSGNATLRLAGPVVITSAKDVSLSGMVNATADPSWLTLRVARGDVSLSGGTTLSGLVVAPSGDVRLDGGASLTGGIAADELRMAGNAKLRITIAVPK